MIAAALIAAVPTPEPQVAMWAKRRALVGLADLEAPAVLAVRKVQEWPSALGGQPSRQSADVA